MTIRSLYSMRVSGAVLSALIVGPMAVIGATPDRASRGRDIWFENTYGGEKFFAFLANHPDPGRRIEIGFEAVVTTPRDQRFDVWGVINDPTCVANPEGGMDLCEDPHASGVIGIRKFERPGEPTVFGVACAACHAGFDPLQPLDDPNEPTWANVHPTIGNQYLDVGAVFSANLPASDARRFMFEAWPDGTVDTSLLFNDGIMNPGVITAFWEHRHRPTFHVGLDEPKMRNGQGGEDDLGRDVAALRVYTNLGVCFFECVADKVATGAPIDIQDCRDNCPDFPPQEDLEDLGAFLSTMRSPRFPGSRGPGWLYARGREVFEANCAVCHDSSGRRRRILTNDEVNLLDAVGVNATHACRALTTNWDTGRIWAQFSSDVYKTRGGKGYRTMPLTGIWATPPFLHNQSVGFWPPPTAGLEQRAEVYRASMHELLSTDRTPVVHTLPVAVGPFPAGTPLQFVFSRAADGSVLCDDVVENRGHFYGADLSDEDKEALIHWLLFQ